MAHLWVIEDDEAIGRGLQRTLAAEGHRVEWAVSAAQAAALPGSPDIVLLDLNLPDGDGLALCAELRAAHPRCRVIILTARDTELDVVMGLDAGAIDYLPKPFRLAELLARVRAQARSLTEPDAPDAAAPTPTRSQARGALEIGDLRIDAEARRVWVADREVELRAKELDLLVRLAIDAGRVVRRETLIADVWNEHWWGSTKTLDVHVASLRRRLGEEPGTASRIVTVRGIGYRLDRRAGPAGGPSGPAPDTPPATAASRSTSLSPESPGTPEDACDGD